MSFLRDIRYAIHTLRRSPAYAAMCVAVLALGIGANAAIFSVLDAVVLDALPYPHADRLVFVWERFPNMPPPVSERMNVAHRNFEEWKRQSTVFETMAAFEGAELDETSAGHTGHVSTGYVSPALFPMLGANPRLGRLFTSEEDRSGTNHVVLLTEGYFISRFHGDPAALGKPLALGKTEYTVIGVLPRKFHLPATYEGEDQLSPAVWVPLSNRGQTEEVEIARSLKVAARLKPGITLARARTEMATIADRLAKPGTFNEGWKSSVFPFSVEDSSPDLHRALYVLMAAVGFLLLIGCANLANLTLARAALRSREIAVRLALGATRGRIVAQLVTESSLVSMAGAAAGLLLAHWSIKLMLALNPENIHRQELIAINLPVFAFAAAASILTTVLFGLAPSLTVSRQDLNTALKSGGTWGGSAARVRSRQFLIVVEVALALVLVAGAGLMIRSFREILNVGIGFDTRRITMADIDLPAKRYFDGAAQSRFFRELIARASAIPGVSGAGVVDNPPLHKVSMNNFLIGGRPDPPISELPIVDSANVSPHYLSLIGLRLEAGRLFGEQDLIVTEKHHNATAMVNRAFAAKYFPGESPLGHRLLSSDKKQTWEIVGVISDYRPMGTEGGARPSIFLTRLDIPVATLMVRATAPAEALTTAIRSTIWSLDKELPAAEVKPMQDYVDEWLSQRKFNTLLLGVFAALALLLGMIGVYGVLANLVTSRVREIGIRMAIGASPAAIGRLVLRQSMTPVAIGLVAGVAASLVLGRFLEALLFQVHPRDPLTLTVSVAAILLISPLAVYVPLRRATRVDCTVALREE